MQKLELYKVAEIEITYTRTQSLEDLPMVNSSKVAADIFRNSWNMNKIDYIEQFKILLLNLSLKPLGIVDISSGGIDSTPVDFRILFGAALKANAASIIAVHNHPSGSLKPSDQDRKLTQGLADAGRLLQIKLQDHLILTRHGFYSFLDNELF